MAAPAEIGYRDVFRVLIMAFMDAAKKQGPITSSISPESFSYDSVMLAAAAAVVAAAATPSANATRRLERNKPGLIRAPGAPRCALRTEA